MTTVIRRLLPSLAIFGVFIGCSGEVHQPITQKTAEERIFGGASADDKEKVKDYLKKANVEGEVVALEDKGTYWLAEVMKRGEPGKRSAPKPPEPYQVQKSDGKVSKM